MRRELSAFAGELSAAGRLASVAPPAVGVQGPALTPGGTAKVPAATEKHTGEMSGFKAVPAVAGPAQRAPLPRTAEMPRAPDERRVAPTIPTPQRPPPPDGLAPAPRKKRSLLLWLTLGGLLLGAAGIGALWILQIMSDPGPPPPMPMPPGYRTAPSSH